MRRNLVIRFRVSQEERVAIKAKAAAQSQSLTDFLRQRALNYRLRKSPDERERIRQLARIGNNLNQLARWANTYKNRAEAMAVLGALLSVERALTNTEVVPSDRQGEEPCT